MQSSLSFLLSMKILTAWFDAACLCSAQTTDRFSFDFGGAGGDADSAFPEISTDG